MAISNIKNTFVRRSVCIACYVPTMVLIIFFGAVKGAWEWTVEFHDAFFQAWQG